MLVGKFPKPSKAVYVQYKKAKDKEKFLRRNESSIIIHEAAAKTLQAAKNGGKLPGFKNLCLCEDNAGIGSKEYKGTVFKRRQILKYLKAK